MTARLFCGDVRDVLATLPEASVQCVVTSPPYWNLRDYGVEGQIGIEPTPDAYVATMVDVMRAVRRVLRSDGTCWVNIGDSYASHDPGGYRPGEFLNPGGRPPKKEGAARNRAGTLAPPGLKPKDLIGIPWRVALALQADGWWLRSDIIWSKPNPMPESVTDRPTRAHEYIFLLAKASRYYYDHVAIREPAKESSLVRWAQDVDAQEGSHRANGGAKTNGTMKAVGDKQRGHSRRHDGFNDRWDALSKDEQQALGANKRTVWTVATHAYSEAHFATFPPSLIEPCILAGSRVGDTVLDPFAGSGTTGMVALRHGRAFVGIDLSPEYVEMARKRITADAPLFNVVESPT